MTNKEKQLLFINLCARIPYEPVVNVKNLGDVYLASVDWWEEVGVKDYTNTLYPLDDVKPYLRPMSSMTEEEEEEFRNSCNIIGFYKDGEFACTPDGYDYLNEHHFDFSGLIPMGLALEAPKDMYKTE